MQRWFEAVGSAGISVGVEPVGDDWGVMLVARSVPLGEESDLWNPNAKAATTMVQREHPIWYCPACGADLLKWLRAHPDIGRAWATKHRRVVSILK